MNKKTQQKCFSKRQTDEIDLPIKNKNRIIIMRLFKSENIIF